MVSAFDPFGIYFVCGVRKWPGLILLHVAVQVSQHHLLKRFFSPLDILVSFFFFFLQRMDSYSSVGLFGCDQHFQHCGG